GGNVRRYMRTIRILACLAAVLALSAVAAASAAASPEFDGEKYPCKLEGAQLNNQGFGDSLGAIAANCENATASTEEERLANPTTNTPTLTAHPIYGLPKPTKCVLTLLGVTSGESVVNSEGCQYTFHAVPPGKAEGTTDVKCGKQAATPTPGNCKITSVAGASCEIKIEAQFLAGCVVSVPPRSGLKASNTKTNLPAK